MRRKISSLLFIFFSVFVCASEGFAGESLFLERILALHPTQKNIGKAEAKDKLENLQKMSDENRERYLQEHPVPVVKGPRGRYYMVDHHHLSFAMWRLGAKVIYVTVIDDFSEMSESDFWRQMIERKYVYLKDEGRPISTADLPQSVAKLRNDRYRSLAGWVRKEGGFLKVGTPYAEFEWADFFRNEIRFPRNARKATLKRLVRDAVILASSDRASHLPGYRFRCDSLFAPR